MKVTTPIVVTLAAAFVAVAGLIVTLVITGHDPTLFVTSILTLVPVVAGIVTIGAKQQKTDTDVTTIKNNTNGTLSNMTALIVKAIGALPPAQAQKVIDEHVSAGGTIPPMVTDAMPNDGHTVPVVPPTIGGPTA